MIICILNVFIHKCFIFVRLSRREGKQGYRLSWNSGTEAVDARKRFLLMHLASRSIGCNWM